MLISVITVCYNSIKTIETCLASVSSQIGVCFEHVLVDGMSSDGTLQRLKAYKYGRPYVKLISEKDQGIYDAMNKGLALARGQLICFLNSDDSFSRSDILFMVVNKILAEKDVDAVLTDVMFTATSGRVIRKVSARWFLPERLRYGWMPPHPGLFLRRRVFDSVGGFDTSYNIAADYDFCIRAFLVHKIKFCIFPICSVEMKLGGISTSGWRSTFIITSEIVDSCKKNNIRPRIFLLFLRIPIKFFLKIFQA